MSTVNCFKISVYHMQLQTRRDTGLPGGDSLNPCISPSSLLNHALHEIVQVLDEHMYQPASITASRKVPSAPSLDNSAKVKHQDAHVILVICLFWALTSEVGQFRDRNFPTIGRWVINFLHNWSFSANVRVAHQPRDLQLWLAHWFCNKCDWYRQPGLFCSVCDGSTA